MPGPSGTVLYEAVHKWVWVLGILVLDSKGDRPKVIPVNFNAWVTEWGSLLTNAR